MDMIWYARNQVIHNSYQVDVLTLLKQIRMTLKTHKQALEKVLPVQNMWRPPPSGFLKANFNVAVRPKFSVASEVISDEDGKVIAASSLKLNSSKVNVR